MTFWKKSSSEKNSSIRKKVPLWSIGVGVGAFFLVLGFYGEQFTDIYRKAVMICLECIGIG